MDGHCLLVIVHDEIPLSDMPPILQSRLEDAQTCQAASYMKEIKVSPQMNEICGSHIFYHIDMWQGEGFFLYLFVSKNNNS